MAQISINSKTHGHHIIFYDSNDANIIAKFSWYIVRRYKMFYAAAHAKNSIGKNTIVYMHRMLVTYNRVDHRNGNGLDNRRENLRESTRHQNKMNSTKHKKLTSVYKGVCWNKKRQEMESTSHSKWKEHFYWFVQRRKSCCSSLRCVSP